ncbi:TonB-dependent receptor domain-containing protein [Chachezhania antarctica]|uniref:TonB-dependent receptor domain-containing protein n=1 Tax=Chachezhania antarctica TaxID=2340860 RepID=UPI000EB23B75|nr:TonB-dependent receptor [Chachezhania antarctica]|tara:strand:- start:4214 stop:6172 length:1959 start_codon:yes stop_codon:yes gene_type:complete
MILRTLFYCSSILALTCASTAMAQDTDPFYLGQIVIDYAGAGDLNEVNVDGEDLEIIEPTDLRDVFKNEPAVSVGSSLPISQKLYVDGVEENNLSVTIDGARQNNKIFHHNATTYIDPELLKRVRVDPGVAPADAGPGALGGAIAFETKDVDDLLAPGLTFGGLFSTEYQSNGHVFSNSLTLMTRHGGFEALLSGKYATGGTQVDGDGNDILGSGTGMSSGLGKFAYETENGGRFEFSYETVRDDDLRPFRADMQSSDGVLMTRRYDLQRENIVFNYTTVDPTAYWDPKFLIAYSSTDLYLPTDSDIGKGKTDSYNGVFQNRFTLPIGTITAGLDFYSDDAQLDYTSLTTPSDSMTPNEKAENVGLFAQARLDPTDRLRVTAGLRGDMQSFTGTDGTTYDNSGLSGNAAVEYAVTDAFSVGAGASRVWGGIALAENFIMNPAWVYPSDGIEPVTSDNYFLAASYDSGPWSLSGRLFQTSIKDARAPSYRAGPAVTADMESEGYEVKAGYNWGSGFVRLGYADIDSTVDGSHADSYLGRYLTTPLGRQMTVEVLQSVPNTGLLFGADAQIAFEEDGFYDGDPADPLPGYQAVNAFVEYVPAAYGNLKLRLQVDNLFDELYTDRATYGQEFVSEGLIPLYQPGRSVSVRATLTF